MAKIISELIEYKNRKSKNIIGYFDYTDSQNTNFIVIPPAFGETKRDSLKLSYFLVKNGFSVIRYDATYHVGESQGDMVDADFGSMKEDLFSTIDFIQKKFNVNGVGIVGTSLGIRVAIKAASEDKRIKFLFGLVGIVDLRSSLKAVYHQDVIGEILIGKYKGKTIDDIMGFEVNINFALSAIDKDYHDLESTKADMRKINIPVVMMNAQNDAWINPDDVKSVTEEASTVDKKFLLIPQAMHQLNENPRAVLDALKQVVVECKKYLLGEEIKPQDVIELEPQELSTQWFIEEERLKNLIKKSLEGEKEFWEKYLNKFVLIHKSSHYRDFLSKISSYLDIKQGEKVLDAGCGNGHFGAWLFDRSIEKIFQEKIKIEDFNPIIYTGLDFAEHSLKEAMLKHLNLTKRVYRELSLKDKYPIIKYRYVLADIETKLPFPDNYFDKICCNLVLSYVKDPMFSLQELMRVLRNNGKLIVSSMKPYADLSQVYRDFVDQTENQEELEEARKLLSAAGRIKQKENAGIYTFFSEEELKQMFERINAKNIEIARSFSNQSNLIVGEK